MPKPTKGPRLGSSPAHEKKILANLAKSLIEHEAIVTTETKAKRLQPLMERLITKARKGDIASRRQIAAVIGSKTSKYEREVDHVYELIDVIVPKIDSEREGGYTRIVKLPARRGDNAPMAQISFVTEKLEKKAVVKDAEETTAKAAADEDAQSEETVAQAAEATAETEDGAAPAEETAETADEK